MARLILKISYVQIYVVGTNTQGDITSLLARAVAISQLSYQLQLF